MKYLLDTHAVSALMRGDATMIARLGEIEKSDVFVPHPVLAEIEYGLARMPKSRKRASLRATFELVRDELQRAPWSDEVDVHFGAAKAELERRGTRLEDFDLAIAAHALALDAVLVTDDIAHMARITGLVVESWIAR
ncbi:MAG TPA: type II toxin-antitoxin system VapC family toxin [Nannocystaceae bacterium]|nr:type II toxin-antitoxin system VapC family toxin [Nannocystaceae bacterium]